MKAHARSWASVLLLVGLAVLARTEAEDGTCSATFQAVPFMKTPVSAEDLDKIITVVQGLLPGSSQPASSTNVKQDVTDYIKTYSLQPIAGIVSMFALVLLSLLVFLLWRFTRCLCVLCCQQETYADGAKVLTSPGIRRWKAAMFVIGLAGMGVAAWGMYSVDKNFPLQINNEVDTIQALPVKLITTVTSLADELSNITIPLDRFQEIIEDVNITGMKKDLEHIDEFFQHAPTPYDLRDILDNMQQQLDSLVVNLSGLAALIDSSNTSSPLGMMKENMEVLQNFTSVASDMKVTVALYNQSLTAVADLPANPDSTTPEYIQLLASQDAMESVDGVSGWLTAVSNSRTAAQAIRSASNDSSLNPFSLIRAQLGLVDTTAHTIQDDIVSNLTATIIRFNSLWYRNASSAVESLLQKAVHANNSVMVLPDNVASQIQTLNTSLQEVMMLYSGPNSLLLLPDNITLMSSSLSMPNITELDLELATAEEQLGNADSSLQSIIEQFDNLTTALDVLQQTVETVNAALDAYEGSSYAAGAWSTLQSTLDGAILVVDPLANVLGGYEPNSFLDGNGTSMAEVASGSALATEASAISHVEDVILDFDLSSFRSALTQAERAYDAFGGDPLAMTTPVKSMLQDVNSMASTQLDDAKAQVVDVRGQIDTALSNVKELAITKIDEMQEKYLWSNSSESQIPLAETYWSYAYLGLLCAYGIVMFLILLVFLFTYINWAAGVCFFSFLLNILLIIFALLPIFYTIFMVLLRDTCANMDTLGLKAVSMQTGMDTMAYKAAHFYLAGGELPDGTATDVGGLLASLNPDYDIAALKGKVNDTVMDVLQDIKADYKLQQPVLDVLADVETRINGLLQSVDGLIDLVDYPSISAVYLQLKGWICCDLTEQLYVQWVSCLVLLATAWVAMICALAVLKRLDTLSESCCACACYNARDYAAEGPAAGTHSSVGAQSSDAETVAVITIGGLPSKKYEAPESQTPLPAPLQVMTSPVSAPNLNSPRMYPSIGPAAPNGGAGYAPIPDLQQQRISLMGQAYPAVNGAYGYGVPMGQPLQQPPPQVPQGWGRNSPSPSGFGKLF